MPSQKIEKVVDSTQEVLKRWFIEQPELSHLSWVRSDAQEHGRGRQGNSWQSQSGNLHLSVLYRLDEETWSKSMTWFPLWVGAQLVQVLESIGVRQSEVYLKWPNDLIVGTDSKLGGILCEKQGKVILVGIGLNVETAPSLQGPTAGQWKQTTCLKDLGVQLEQRTLDGLAEKISQSLAHRFQIESLKATLEKVMVPKPGDSVVWRESLGAEPKSGVVLGLGGFGELKVINTNGDHVQLFSEEVKILK